jgi:hypothetical protein
MQQLSILLSWRLFTAQHVSGVFPPIIVVGPAGRTTNTVVRLSPRYEGKTRGCRYSHWVPDDGRENARNMWAVNKRQDNKMENCCIWLAIYLNCTVMHGLTNLKSIYVLGCIDGWYWQNVNIATAFMMFQCKKSIILSDSQTVMRN